MYSLSVGFALTPVNTYASLSGVPKIFDSQLISLRFFFRVRVALKIVHALRRRTHLNPPLTLKAQQEFLQSKGQSQVNRFDASRKIPSSFRPLLKMAYYKSKFFTKLFYKQKVIFLLTVSKIDSSK